MQPADRVLNYLRRNVEPDNSKNTNFELMSIVQLPYHFARKKPRNNLINRDRPITLRWPRDDGKLIQRNVAGIKTTAGGKIRVRENLGVAIAK